MPRKRAVAAHEVVRVADDAGPAAQRAELVAVASGQRVERQERRAAGFAFAQERDRALRVFARHA